jgi:hypothetical protein
MFVLGRATAKVVPSRSRDAPRPQLALRLYETMSGAQMTDELLSLIEIIDALTAKLSAIGRMTRRYSLSPSVRASFCRE